MIEIKNLHVEVEGKEILRGVNLKIREGEVHAIMGSNGSGKSTLAFTILGHPKYKITKGKILFNGKNINKIKTDGRARLGIFLSMQHPVEIEGIKLGNLAWQSFKSLGEPKDSILEFRKKIKEKVVSLKIEESFVDRDLNVGFSGGEKKKAEILQMQILKPKIAIIDEVDSGLDVDSLKIISKKINEMRDGKFGCILITHYKRILEYVKPDFVHVIVNGKIVKSGKDEIIKEIEERGYSHLKS